MSFKICFLSVVFASFFGGEALAQHIPSTERVDPTLRRRTEIDGNNLRTSVFNFVFSGRTGVGQGVPYEWPKNTGRHYVALLGLFVGAEVVDDTGRVVRIVDLPAYRENPATGADWNMNPVPGYFNPTAGKIAKSDEPGTWPAFWPDKVGDPNDPGWRKENSGPPESDDDPDRAAWNGFFGKNQFSADQEMYYRAGDDNYNRFLYRPDSTDPSRRGIGMLVDVRALEWSQVSVADAAFFIQEFKNDGTKDIKKAAVTLWLADFVGGDGDSQDDKPDFDLILDVAFSLDADGVSSNPAFQGAFVGAAATLYLETPGNATDHIDNDGDSPDSTSGPKVTGAMIATEIPGNQIDDNGNGLVDEDSTHIPFGAQRGVTFADRIANDTPGESGSPLVTSAMISGEIAENAIDDNNNGAIDEDPTDVGKAYKDGIDNNGNGEVGSQTITQAIVDAAALNGGRYVVNGQITLYNVTTASINKAYADGIDNDGNGLVDEGIDEDIDVMIDESRNDGIDNDGDWTLADDVGLDGAPGTGDFGEGDGKPTSGVGTNFPGEPNIDKTDVSEADMVGLTNVQYIAAGAINFSTTADGFFWGEFMLPGRFVNPALIPVGESDLFVSSGVFPMKAGQIERISYSVVFGAAVRAGNANISGAKDDAIRKSKFARLAYEEDYQFAQAPVEPVLTAVPGDRKVTLYWDDGAEKSRDRFLAGIPGAPEFDFEGYRIYRATDPAFEDARLIRDAYGSPAPWLRPITQFDLKDGIKGFHPIPFNGVQFDMGTDTGLLHSWIDSSVVNGQKYYYAVRAFDQGYTPLSITPAESNLKISIDPVTSEVTSIGTSVAIVTPQASAAGYVGPNVSSIKLIQGTTTGTVDYHIVDPRKILDNHKYQITFEDTLYPGRGTPAPPDTVRTKSFTLRDVTGSDSSQWRTIINKSRMLSDTVEQPITDGFRLFLRNEKRFGVNNLLSGWNNSGVWDFTLAQWKVGFIIGGQKPADYRVEFGPLGTDTSTSFNVGRGPEPAISVNFKVINTSENKQIDFAFVEFDQTGGPGIFSARGSATNLRDHIVFLERDARDSLAISWEFSAVFDTTRRAPTDGDIATIVLSKLFRASDVFEFSTKGQFVDNELAKNSLNNIKVVPNPYVVTASWEEASPYSSGRGPRKIEFTHLPQKCTIRIFTVSGELVRTIEHESGILDGSESWDLLTRDNLSVAYGLYIYHVDAGEIGERVGKFAVIK